MSQIRAEDVLLFVTDGQTPLKPQNLFKVVLTSLAAAHSVIHAPASTPLPTTSTPVAPPRLTMGRRAALWLHGAMLELKAEAMALVSDL
jgi:hypothetical protein